MKSWWSLLAVVLISALLISCGSISTPTSTPTLTPTQTAPSTPTSTPKLTPTPTPTPTVNVIFSDNFDNETTVANPSKWNIVEPTGTDISIDDTVYFGTSGKSAKMQSNSPTQAPNMNRIIGTQTGEFWYEVSIRLAQTNHILGGAYIGNSTVPGGQYGIENLGVSIAFWSDGYIKYNDNDNDLSAWKNVQTYQADKWYTVKVFVDVPNQKFNLYVDNVLKLTDIKFRYPMTSLDQITAVGRVAPPSSTIWIDSVLVSKAP